MATLMFVDYSHNDVNGDNDADVGVANADGADYNVEVLSRQALMLSLMNTDSACQSENSASTFMFTTGSQPTYFDNESNLRSSLNKFNSFAAQINGFGSIWHYVPFLKLCYLRA
uniref:Uncharacterized protein n=1 Tax=Glossina palpalis gambiensis TaxID=67801 RepID=A0A1B0BCZ9_9MUSC